MTSGRPAGVARVARLLRAGLSVVLLGVGCSDRQPEELVTEEDAEALEAIGYVSHSPTLADPTRSGVTTAREGRMQPGLTFTTLGPLCRAKLIDSAGQVLHEWAIGDCRKWSHAELLPDGGLVVSALLRKDGVHRPTRVLLKVNASSEEVWRLDLTAHHDQIVEPDGRMLVLVKNDRPAPAELPGDTIVDNLVAEVDPHGRTVRELSLYDTLDRREFGPTERVRSAGRRRLDMFHANSLAWMPAPSSPEAHPIFRKGNLLLSLRHQDRVIVVDWARGELVWQWGRGVLSGPHDASPLPNGHILVFDNRMRHERSRVIEIDPTRGRIAWQYPDGDPEAAFYTESRGSAQRLANGNTLICDSNNGRIVEVGPDGETVWEYWEPTLTKDGFRAVLIRAYRYSEAYCTFLRDPRPRGTTSHAPTPRTPVP